MSTKAQQRGSAKDDLADARLQLRRVVLLTEAAEGYLELYRGCEIDRQAMLDLFQLIHDVVAPEQASSAAQMAADRIR